MTFFHFPVLTLKTLSHQSPSRYKIMLGRYMNDGLAFVSSCTK